MNEQKNIKFEQNQTCRSVYFDVVEETMSTSSPSNNQVEDSKRIAWNYAANSSMNRTNKEERNDNNLIQIKRIELNLNQHLDDLHRPRDNKIYEEMYRKMYERMYKRIKNDKIYKRMYSFMIIVLNLLIILSSSFTSVNSLQLNQLNQFNNQLQLTNLANSTLNQLTSFNTYSGAIQIQYQTPNETVNFTHVAYDSSTGKLYIGAINSLLQLNSDLNIEQQIQTGPLMDSVQCSASDCSQADLVNTPNIAKVLLIDQFSQKLIFCGTVKQGSCVRHSLSNVSQVESLVPIPVAANDEHSSTVAIIAPSTKASFYSSSTSHVMYVAATNSKLGPYRDMIPAICTRSLEPGAKLFNVLEKDVSEISRLDLEFHLRDYYLVNYVYAFYTSSHIYFATTQPRSASKAYEELGYSSKLARLCLEDTLYNTYAEITLQCVDKNGDDYPLLQTAYLMDVGSDLKRNLDQSDDRVLMAVFTKSRDHTNTPGLSSAICLYSVSAIERAFDENIRSCLNGTISSRNMDYIANNIMECPSASNENTIKNNDLCQETIKLNGSNPLVASSAIVFSNETLTAIAGLTVAQHTVALVGTANGHLKKILISGSTSAHEFEDVQVDEGQRILADLHIDPTRRFAFVASPYKIAKVLIERCQTFNTCRECLQTKNPYCGWCSLEKRCTTRSTCSSPLTKPTNRWISMDAQKCIDFQLITPDSLPIHSNSTIELVINQLPKLPSNAHYLCVFENATSKATITTNGLICNSPPSHLRPTILSDRDHASVELAIRSSETKTNFLSRNYTFYDCSVHRSCSSCLNSNWKCNWCMRDNKCQDAENQCSKRNGLTYNSNIQNVDSCPKIHNSEEINIPNGVPSEIYSKLVNLPTEASHSMNSLVCLVEYEQQAHRVPAILMHQNTIKCQKNIYTYESKQGLLTAKLSLIWNKQVLLDKVNLTMYKCELLGSHSGRSDCSLCLAQAEQYECGWCSGQCRHQTHLRSDANCASQQQDNIKCPFPRIDWVHPLSGPIEGGTQVVIEGSNLGSSLKEIANSITIGGVPCTPISYNVSVKVICQTGRSSQIMQEDILIGNRAGYTRAREKFRYEQVEVYDIWPRVGPKSGGTRLYIQGVNLNIGSNVEVLLDDTPCVVDRTLASSQQISCITPSLNTIQEQSEQQYTKHLQSFYANAINSPQQQSVLAVISHLKLKIDNLIISKSINFTYVDDPAVKKISPLRSPISGGRIINVYGSNFKSIQQPRMIILAVDGIHILNETICTVQTDEYLICPSPPINNQLFQLIRQEEQQLLTPQLAKSSELNGGHIRLKIGFHMGNVQSVRHLSHHSGLYSLMTYVPDPQFTIFGSSTSEQSSINASVRYINAGEQLTLQGIYLKASNFDENEINITIGLSPCNLTSYTSNQITCIPPTQLPLPSDELGRRTVSRLPMVVVRMGTFLRYELGYLAYNGQLSEYNSSLLMNYGTNGNQNAIIVSTHHHQQPQNGLFNSNNSILLLIVSTCTLIVICVCGLLFLRHKNSATEREYKKIQLQMDTLENQVRYECKSAFIELQTDMINISKELQTSGIPTLDHRIYVMKVFFPGVHNHPLLINPPSSHTYQQINAHHGLTSPDSIHYHSTDIYNQQSNSNPTSDYISYYTSNYEVSMDQFKQLLSNKCFLLLFINTLEQQRQFSIKDRVNVASLITIIFMDSMNYLNDILSILLYQFIEKSVRCNKHPQLMLRRTESVVEKMLANWLALHMYDYLRSKSGRSLFMLFSALKHQIEKGPVDQCSNEARYSLSEDALLKENIDYQQIEVQLLSDGLIDSFNLLEHNQNKNFQTIKLNDCDSISQVKSKILDVIYRNTSYSQRPSIHNLDLEWRQPNSNHSVILQDDDSSSLEINGWRRVNTLRHYGVHTNALMRLTIKPKSLENSIINCDLKSSPSQCNSDYGTYGLSSVLSSNVTNGQSMFMKNLIQSNNQWHLIKPQAVYAYEQTHSNQLLSLTSTFKSKNSHLVNLNDKISLLSGLNHNFNRNTLSTSSILPNSRLTSSNLNTTSFLNGNSTMNHNTTKHIPEIYLTRLLATKGTTQKFIDDFLGTILTVDDQFPQAVKWLFDLLDEAARMHGISDPIVVHSWKCNILPLRFWVNFVKNPELIFDIHKTPTIDSSLSIVAQLLMDICSDNDTRLGKDSPSNKLLFAKDLDVYKTKLSKFYDDIAASMPVTEHEMSARLDYLSAEHAGEFDSMIALKDLYVYAAMYAGPIIDQLASNTFCVNVGLLDKFKNIVRNINGQCN